MFQKCEKFFCETYIIGLSEIYRTKHNLVRFLWICFLITGICLTLTFISFILQDYRNNPTVTKVYTETKDKYDFPPIYVIVPFLDRLSSVWSNKSLSQDGIVFLQSLRRLFPPNRTQYLRGLADVRKFSKRWNLSTVSDLYMNVDRNLEDFVNLTCTICDQTTFAKSRHLADEYFLYEVPFYSANYREIYLVFQTYQVTIDVMNSSQQLFLGIGKQYKLLSLSNYVPLNVGQDYQVRINAKRLKRYNTVDSSCVPYTEEYSLCLDSCIRSSLLRCNCSYDRYGAGDIFNDNPCSTLLVTPNGNCSMDAAMEIMLGCSKKCLPMCDETIYDYSTVTVPNGSKNRITVTFYLMFTDTGIMTYEETPSFTFVSAISNVGSQLGLWLGLSVVSFIQIGLLFLNHFLDRKESRVIKIDKDSVQKVRY